MSISAANPAGLPHVSLRMVERANKSLPRCNGGGELRLFLRRTCAARMERAIAAAFSQPRCR